MARLLLHNEKINFFWNLGRSMGGARTRGLGWGIVRVRSLVIGLVIYSFINLF
jgi:hypothetical protein